MQDAVAVVAGRSDPTVASIAPAGLPGREVVTRDILHPGSRDPRRQTPMQPLLRGQSRSAVAATLLSLVLLPMASVQAQDAHSSRAAELRRADAETVSPRVLREIREASIPLEVVSRMERRTTFESPGAAAEQGSRPEDRVDPEPGIRPPTPAPSASVAGTGPPAAVIDLAALRRRGSVATAQLHSTAGDGAGIDLSGSDVVTLQAGHILTLRDPQATAITSTEQGVAQAASPSLLLTIDAAGELRQLTLVHRVQDLVWNHDRNQYTGTLLVGLIDATRPLDIARLAMPVPVQMLAAGAQLAPGELEIRWIGGRFERVDVAIVDPEDPLRIALVSQVDPDLPAAEIPLRRIPLVIRAPAQIDALGLESATVTVRARSGRLPAGSVVSLALDNGVLDESDLTVDASGMASTRMSSTRFGEARLAVIGGPYVADPVTVRYAPPWLFLCATTLGAMLGAALYVYAVFRSGRRRRWLPVDWGAGVIAGIGITAMLYAGIRLPEWFPTPEKLVGAVVPFAVTFVAAAMAAAVVGYLTGMRPQRGGEKPRPAAAPG